MFKGTGHLKIVYCKHFFEKKQSDYCQNYVVNQKQNDVEEIK